MPNMDDSSGMSSVELSTKRQLNLGDYQMVSKISKVTAAFALTSMVFLSGCQTSAVDQDTDSQSKVTLKSFNVKSSNPATMNDWKRNPLAVEGIMSYPKGDGPFPVVVYLLSSGGYQKNMMISG